MSTHVMPPGAHAGTQAHPHADPIDPPIRMSLDSGRAALEAGRPWRVAAALQVLLQQVDAAYPHRGKASDGTIGDAAHQGRQSDHNPHVVDGPTGVVTALDVTHDPAHGCDAGRLAAALHASRDPRIKYIIWNRRIANASPIGGAPAWAWRVYTGANPHDRHCHVSVKASKELYDDPSPWAMPSPPGAVESAAARPEEGGDESAPFHMALATLGGLHDLPLPQALAEAADAIAMLQRRHAQMWGKASEAAALEATRPTAEQLSGEYRKLFDTCVIAAARRGEVAWHRERLLENRGRYDEVSAVTGAPWWFVGIVHAMEASFSFAGHLHNGDPLTARTVQVPAGRPKQWNPPSDWASSAADAISFEGYSGKNDWSLPVALFRFESYNGFGYHNRGISSPYLWSFSNHYTRGKYVGDGVFDPMAVSKQCGAAVMLKALVEAGDIMLA